MINAHGRGTLSISSLRSNGYVKILFADDGPGIPPDIVKYIFDPFYTTKGVGQGTGLRLNISYGIIQEHHGRISVENNQEKGATFIVELPVNDKAPDS